MVAEKTGYIDSPREQGRRPLAMSRHRFLMLGASIVGVGMLPFAQRNYAYAASNVSTDNYSTPATRADATKHTQILHDMFFDKRLKPPYNFRLMPNKPGGEPLGWWVDMGGNWASFPVKSSWTLTGGADGATTVDSSAGLYRYGKVVTGRIMFRNADTKNGNDDIRFERVYVDGRKFAATTVTGINGNGHFLGERDGTPNPETEVDFDPTYTNAKYYYDVDQLLTFVRIGQNPDEQPNRWNFGMKFLGCEVRDWPGISCEFRQVNDFEVSDNKIVSSHRGSFIFRLGARFGTVNNNVVENGGDDCIAFNGNQALPDQPNTGGAGNVSLTGNYLGEKQGQDIREPAGYRHRGGNSPLAIRHAEAGRVDVTDTTVTQTEDGYTDWEGGSHPPQPAVEVRDRQGLTSRDVHIVGLYVGIDKYGKFLRDIGAPALWIPSSGVTGHIDIGVCEQENPPNPQCPWQLAPSASTFIRSNLSPDTVCVP